MAKRNVWELEAPCFPLIRVEIESRTGAHVFFIKKQDAYDETSAGRLFRQMCDNYLGEPLKVNKTTRKVTERKKPEQHLQPVKRADGEMVAVKPDEDIFFAVA